MRKNMKERILIIEDDLAIAEIERDFLEMNGYETEIIGDGAEGLKRALEAAHDLILLDLMLPGLDGFEICRKIRDSIEVPILMVSARGEDLDKIRGLGLGADDYISKPFSPQEMVARVKSHLARYRRLTGEPRSHQREISFGRVRLKPEARQVFVEERELDLTNKEFELLLHLLTRPNQVFSKEQLYESIWGADSYGDLKTVVVHINRLREKIESDPSKPRYIQTVWGVGYRFIP